ncbi:MAG: PKD domain-containing protein [Crocinitomicaceae bacterium]|nr:PKD domain-containing protein [Crocinitomicaceae bacterium]
MKSAVWKILILLTTFFFGVLKREELKAQCPRVYDFFGAPSSQPYWYSCTGTSFSFNLQSPDNWDAYTINWGDGNSSSGNSWNTPAAINHVYSAAVDTFIVTITEVPSGCSIQGVVVMEQATSASIQIPVGGLTQACAPKTMEFINSSTNVSETTVFSWDFGDGTPPLTFDHTNWHQTISHLYDVGSVNCETQVSLTAENYCNTIQGGSSTATFNPIRIWDLDDPGITASATLLCYPDTTVTFSNTTHRNCYLQGNIYQRYEKWNFGDYWNLGHDSIIDWTPWPPTFPHTMHYPGIGTYQVQLLDSNFCGIAETAITIQIVPPPVADITVNPDTVCVGNPTTFYQHATGGANSFSWNFGTGAGWFPTGSGNISYTFNQPGTYTVRNRVAVSGASGACADTAAVQVVVLPKPTVDISADILEGCDSLSVNYNTTSTNAITWNWIFDVAPNNYSGNTPPTINYNTPGTHTTSVTVTSPNGCSAQDNISVNVFSTPEAAFSIFNLCEGDSAEFTDITLSLPTSPITSWNWDFGDGNTSMQQHPTHFYYGTGSYMIILEVSNGHCSDTTSSLVSVEAVAVADIGVSDTTGCSPLQVLFSNATTGAAGYLWNFGDGTTSADAEPAHTFYNTGTQDTTFMITMEALNAFGCASRDTLYVIVKAGALAAFEGLGVPPGCSPFAAQFTNTSQNAGSYFWEFGDNTTSSIENPSHVYVNTTGFLQTYNVTLYALAANGCNDTISSSVVVFPQARFDFTLPSDSGCGPLTVTMPFISGVQTYFWNFGDGTTSAAAVPAHTFTNSSLDNVSYTITMTGMSPFGCVDTATSIITVSPTPVSQFSAGITSGCSPLVVGFTNLSGAADSYSWSYGDGHSSTIDSLLHTHTFINNTPVTQTYTVQLTATNEEGCIDQFSLQIQVFPGVVAGFQDPGPRCSPANIVFTNTSGSGYTYHWDFGNGLQSTDINPSAYFLNNGTAAETFDITLTVTNSNGCSDVHTLPLTVHPNPQAIFTLNSSAACEPTPLVIYNQSTLATSYSWQYGDGTGSNNSAAEHFHLFQTPGNIPQTFTILLTAYSEIGCADTTSAHFTLYPEVSAAFAVDTVGCSPFHAGFVNQSVGGTSYSWQFGDGTFSSANNPDHIYTTDNITDVTYNAVLMVENNYGCADTLEKAIHVNHLPVAVAQLDSTAGCYPLRATFYNGSIGADSYQWVYGTGEVSNTPAEYHDHTYFNFSTEPVTYTIILNAHTANGCSSSDNLTVTVSPQLRADFDMNDEGCPPLNVTFDNTSDGAFTYEWQFGDGESSVDTEPDHTFFNFGHSDTTYSVSLIVFNQYGCSDTLTSEVLVYALPEAAFTATPESQMWPSASVTVTNTTLGGTLNYAWNLGDGTDLYTPSPSVYTYSTWGEYTIRQIADNGFCSDTAFRTITILPPHPVANFEGPAEGCAPLTVQFTNLSEYDNSSTWLFGDGGTANATNPVYTYWAPGTYTVTLIAHGYGDNDDQIIRENIIHVFPRASAAFMVTPNEVSVPGQPVTCVNISQNASEFQWDFSDGNSTNEVNPVHYYQNEGIYSVTLIANNEFNCPDTMTFVDAVYAKPGGEISFPNAFTPNTGGSNGGIYDPMGFENDVFFPLHAGVDEFQLQIFNKWGELLFESRDVNRGWDGYYRGQLCKQDVYVWKVKARFVDGQQYVKAGDVTLLVK